jgi:hypothetical protein
MSQRQLRSNRRGNLLTPPSAASAIPASLTPSSSRRCSTCSKERCSACPRLTSSIKTTIALSMESSKHHRNTPTPTNPNGESTKHSPTPTPTNSRAGSLKSTLYKYTIRNIPPEFAGQKKFHTLLTTYLLVKKHPQTSRKLEQNRVSNNVPPLPR